MLRAENLHIAYGDAPALWDVSMTVADGELAAVVGPNGAGKTTLVNALARLLPVRQGKIVLDGEDVTRASPQAMCHRGVAIIPEGRRLFTGMSVEENLDMGCYRSAARARRAQSLDHVFALFPILAERRRQIAGTMSGGQQQMLAIGRALMACPKLLLIDEPSLGLSPLVVEQVFAAIRRIHAEGTTMLLIEQNVAIAIEVAQRMYVIENGRLVTEGRPDELMAQPHVRAAYLAMGVDAGPER